MKPPRRWVTGHALVVSQLALGVVVIAVAGLLARSLYNLKTLDAGFNGDQRAGLHARQLRHDARLGSAACALYAELQARLRTLPGVTRVAASRSVPVHTSGNARAARPAGPPDTSMDRSAFTNMMTPGYFETFGIRLLRGRDFTDRDTGRPAQSPSSTRRWRVCTSAIAIRWARPSDFSSEPDSASPWSASSEDTHQMNLAGTGAADRLHAAGAGARSAVAG